MNDQVIDWSFDDGSFKFGDHKGQLEHIEAFRTQQR